MDHGYRVHLANPAAIQKYTGLKYADDEHEAFWLAEMLRSGILPEWYIYPKEDRASKDKKPTPGLSGKPKQPKKQIMFDYYLRRTP
jgi:hypothetical protein